MNRAGPRLAILGAGPIGLDAALAAAEQGLDFTVYEAADRPGGNVRDWGHVRLFTPWEMNVSERMRRALPSLPGGPGARRGSGLAGGPGVPGGSAPDGGSGPPTGHELAARLLDPLWSLPALAGRLQLGTRVEAIAREGLLKHEEIATPGRGARRFRLLLSDADGSELVAHADAVIDCTGVYGNPNALGDGGIPAIGERALAGRIERRLPAFERAWAGSTTLLTGAGHSAQTAARALATLARDAPGTRTVWAVRSQAPTWGAVDSDPLPERASLTRSAQELAAGASDAVDTRLGRVTEALRPRDDGRVDVTLRCGDGGFEAVTVDRVLALNGGAGDFSIYRQLQVHECYATGAPMKLSAALLASNGEGGRGRGEGGASGTGSSGGSGGDCLTQESHGPETLTNPEPGFFILGAKSYGRNSQFLLRIGYEQVDDVVGLLRG